MKNLPDEQLVPEEKIGAILARAAELDHQVVTLDALRSAAVEAGISSAAIDQAFTEYAASIAPTTQAGDVDAKPSRLERFKRWAFRIGQPVVCGALSVFFGVLSGRTEPLMALAIIAWVTIAARLALHAREERSSGLFQITMLLMTIGVRVGFYESNGSLMPSDRITFMTVLGIVLFLLGTLYIHSKPFGRHSGTESTAV
jgi:hypothetical protein